MLVAPSVFLGPNSFDPILIIGFVAAVIGGLDSPPGAVVGGARARASRSPTSRGYEGSALVPLAALAILVLVLHGAAHGPVLGDRRSGACEPAPRRALALRRSTLLRVTGDWSLVCGVVLLRASASSSAPTTTCSSRTAPTTSPRLPGLTVLAGLSGQISLGHGALMAVGAYTVALLIGNEHWALVPALVAAVVVTALVGVALGAAGEPPARALSGGRDARLRGRAAGTRRQVSRRRSGARTGS